MSNPPPRPTSSADLDFSMRRAVDWFSPPVLARAGLKVVLSSAFGDYLDKRELQHSLPADIIDEHRDESEVWIDFVADTGDGFDPTYTVAWCLSQPELQFDGLDPLPRGTYLVCGGDEVYPVGSPEEYEDRFVGPYRAALPWTASNHPYLLAIPGNHDWYDGLTGFMRVFGQRSWVGGRRTIQRRSYFAIALPHGHWLWGIDVQNDSYVDVAQIAFFQNAALQMRPGNRLILCTAKPSWVNQDDPDAYRNLKYVQHHLVPSEVETVLTISGDVHHYSKYVSTELEQRRALITSGGGGAFLSATHRLPRNIEIPRSPLGPADPRTATDHYSLAGSTYPSAEVSRRMTFRALLIGWWNHSFLAIPAVLHVLLLMSSSGGLRTTDESFDSVAPGWSFWEVLTGRFRSPALNVLLVVLVAFLAAFWNVADDTSRLRQGIERVLVGSLHAALHVVAYGLVAWGSIQVLDRFGPGGFLFTLAVGLLVFVVGGLVGSLAFGAYLTVSFGLFGRHGTEAFSAFRHEGYKNFLRLRVDSAGVTVHAIGIAQSCKNWTIEPSPDTPDASHLAPANRISATLIEPPFTL